METLGCEVFHGVNRWLRYPPLVFSSSIEDEILFSCETDVPDVPLLKTELRNTHATRTDLRCQLRSSTLNESVLARKTGIERQSFPCNRPLGLKSSEVEGRLAIILEPNPNQPTLETGISAGRLYWERGVASET